MTDNSTKEEIKTWHKYFGMETNNRAWSLSEKANLTEDESREMVLTAFAAAWHWSKIGTDVHFANADMLLGHVLALSGQGAPAMDYARKAFDFFDSRKSDPWEIAFSHAVLAHAAYVNNDAKLHTRHYKKARSFGEILEDPEDRDIFMATFNRIPIPGKDEEEESK